MAGSLDHQWRLSQFREADEANDADVTCLKFNRSGEYLAVGDKGGQISVYQQDRLSKEHSAYVVYTRFQSHEPEFDYLKSVDIEEKINDIQWVRNSRSSHLLLSTNDKTVKLWKISERNKELFGYNIDDDDNDRPPVITELRLPVVKPVRTMIEASPRRVFANAHAYHVNSISINSDQETFLSADDLRINLWHLEISNQSFNIVDIKPPNMEELTEVITAAEFHPTECNLFVYSSSKGCLRLCDMRSQALCDQRGKLFYAEETDKNFFTDVISSVSDVKFSVSGQKLMSRDYLTIKLWDLRMESEPTDVLQVNSFLRSKLCSLYENDCLFDKFECCWGSSDRHLLTGSYNNFFRLFDHESHKDGLFEAAGDTLQNRQPLKPKKVYVAGQKRRKDEISVESLDFAKKLLHVTWHPSENMFAMASSNNWYLFEGS